MPACPICATHAHQRFSGTPYWTCPNCDAWFQSPLPPKVYEAAHEKDAAGGFTGHLMSAHDQAVNRALAQHLLATALRGAPARTLEQLVAAGTITYVQFPAALVGKYQSFTQADLSALRAAGYTAPMATVEEGVSHYVERLMAGTA